MPIARKVTRYCITMTNEYKFDQWVLQGSHDSLEWITLHVGNQAAEGKVCFDVDNHNYYEYYRIKIFNWLTKPGIVQVDFYERRDDYTTTTSTYTTTSTSTQTTATTTSTSVTSSTSTTLTSTSTYTTLPVLRPLSFVTVYGTAGSYEVFWSSSPYASYYEVQFRYNEGDYYYLLSTHDQEYVGSEVPETASSIQFRVRYYSGIRKSNWTESNVLTFSEINANFKASFQNDESEDYLVVWNAGERIQFTDLSSSDHGNIVSWNWTFYSDKDGLSIHNTYSEEQNPEKLYLTKGLFAVKLTVTDSTGRTKSVLKKGMIEVGCHLLPDFQALTPDGVVCSDYIEVLKGTIVRFMDTSSGSGLVTRRFWEFGLFEDYGGLSETSTFLYPCKKYSNPGEYNVALTVFGEYGQQAFISKPRFVRVINKDISTSTTWTSTSTTFTTTTVTTTTLTTSPPENWLRIPCQGGIALCSSYEYGFEPYKAFDFDETTAWRPSIPTTTTSTTTTYTTTTTSTTTTLDFFLARMVSGLLWDIDTDLYDFRENFLEVITPENVYHVRKVHDLIPFNPIYEGLIIYVMSTDKYFVGLSTGWSQINPDYVPHVLSHTDSRDRILKIGDTPPQEKLPGIMWIVPDTSEKVVDIFRATKNTLSGNWEDRDLCCEIYDGMTGFLFVIGGQSLSSGSYKNTVLRINPDNSKWDSPSISGDPIPYGRHYSAFFIPSIGKYYVQAVLLDQNGNLSTPQRIAAGFFDTVNLTWQNITSSAYPTLTDRCSCAYDDLNHCIWMHGGDSSGGIVNQLWKYSISDNTWVQVEPDNFDQCTARVRHCMVYEKSWKLYIYGGVSANGDFLSSIGYVDLMSNRYEPLYPSGTAPALANPKYVYDPIKNRIILFGGMTSSNTWNHSVYIYSVYDNAWTSVPWVGDEYSRSHTIQSACSLINGVTYTVGGDSEVSPDPSYYKLVFYVIQPSTLTTTTTQTTTTATTLWIGNEAILGTGFYPQSSSFVVGHESSKAFDGDLSTYWKSEYKVSESQPQWLGMYWQTPKAIKWYKFFCKNEGIPYTWSLQASRNGLTWIELDYRFEEIFDGWKWYGIANDVGYSFSFYRVVIYNTSDGKAPQIYSLEMYQSIV